MKYAVLLLAGCNQVYGLDPTVLQIDAPGPKPPVCTPMLEFSPRVEQVIVQNCSSYVPAVELDRALASCGFGPEQVFAEGKRDGALAKIAFESGSANGYLESPRLAPEGDRAIVKHNMLTAMPAFSMYHRAASRWEVAYDLVAAAEFDDTMGTPSRRPSARVLYSRPNVGLVDELVEDPPGTWRVMRSYSTAELGINTGYSALNLTPDGLHAIVQGAASVPSTQQAIFHLWRDSLDAKFGPAVPVVGVPRLVTDAFMTNDCGRVYFSGLSSIFYTQQL
jgi:hypothetical protein